MTTPVQAEATLTPEAGVMHAANHLPPLPDVPPAPVAADGTAPPPAAATPEPVKAKRGRKAAAEVAAPSQAVTAPTPTSESTQDPLEALAAEIRKEHASVLEADQNKLGHARNSGNLLLQAKKKLSHGKWAAWVEDHCKFSIRTAQAYMRVAQHWREIALKSNAQEAALFGIEGALSVITKKRPPTTESKSTPVRGATPVIGGSTGSQAASTPQVVPPTPEERLSSGVDAPASAAHGTTVDVIESANEEPVNAVGVMDDAASVVPANQLQLEETIRLFARCLSAITDDPGVVDDWAEDMRNIISVRLLSLRPLIFDAAAVLRHEKPTATE